MELINLRVDVLKNIVMSLRVQFIRHWILTVTLIRFGTIKLIALSQVPLKMKLM